MRILQDLVSGRMNFRKFLLWAFAVYLLLVLSVTATHVAQAVIAVAQYVQDNPAVVN